MEIDQVVRTEKFGCFCPYYRQDPSNGRILVSDSLTEAISGIPVGKREIDPVACLALLRFNYILGDRTLIKGISKMPWHAELNIITGELSRSRPIPHGNRLAQSEEIAAELHQRLRQELASYLEGHSKVWVLLSGGLDSRIVAGVIHEIESDFNTDVYAVTWGVSNSRDVSYAKRIAEHLGWPWVHIPYDEALMWQNIHLVVGYGGEVSGLHLHGMHALKDLVCADDVVIAAAYGDSIGRAEFRGFHLTRLQVPPISNPFGLLHRSIADDCARLATADRVLAWCTEPDQSVEIVNDLDMQENYMRRMIGYIMNYIRQFCELEQAFTSPDVVEYMWSFSPVCRQTEVYFRLLQSLDPFLLNLPWARTGIAPSGMKDQNPELLLQYHHLGRWCRECYRKELENLLLDGGLASLGIFNMSRVEYLLKKWLGEPVESMGLTEMVVKLASLELARQRWDLCAPGDITSRRDKLISWLLKAKEIMKRIAIG